MYKNPKRETSDNQSSLLYNPDMRKTENHQKIIASQHLALIFFVITGFLHLFSSILIANKLWLDYSFAINRTMDLPFIISGLIYGLSSLKLNLTDSSKPNKKIDLIFNIIIIVSLLSLLAINLLIPDLK